MKLTEIQARNYTSAVGWEEKEILYHIRLLAGKGNSAELGVSEGGSLAYIAAAQAEFERGKVYAISPWDEKYLSGNWDKTKQEVASQIGFTQLGHFKNKWERLVPDLTQWIEMIPYASFDVTTEQKEAMRPLVFIFIDAWHDGDAPYRDTLYFAPYVEVGGYIIYHDWGWGNHPPFLNNWVMKAYDELRAKSQEWSVEQHPMLMNLGIARRMK